MSEPKFLYLTQFDGRPIIIRADYILRIYTDVYNDEEFTKVEFINGVTEVVKDSVTDIQKYLHYKYEYKE